MIRCSTCQQDAGTGTTCAHCQAPLAPDLDRLPARVRLPDGRMVDCSAWQGVWPEEYGRPQQATLDDRPCRVYALSAAVWPDLAAEVAARAARPLEVLAPLVVVPVGAGAIVVAEALPGAESPLAEAPPRPTSLFGLLDETLAACRLLAAGLRRLHQDGLVWLNFHPAALHVAGEQLQIAALDLRLFHPGRCPPDVSPAAAYLAPEVATLDEANVGPATDVYHLALYAYYHLAGLLPGGFAGEGPAAFDFALPQLRLYRPQLPPGIGPVLARALARDVASRPASPDAFLDALAAAIARARQRWGSSVVPRLEVGSATATGRTHQVQGTPNQDALAVVAPAADTLLAIVADGVSTARVGSGEQASRLAVEVLQAAIAAALPLPPERPPREVLLPACLQASGAILTASLAEAGDSPVEPLEVMSTTAVIAVIQGNELVLASVGDSRAYLVRDGTAEQLTVDGDLGSLLLARGTPPEQVLDLGDEAHALYGCLGIGEPAADGTLVPCERRPRPGVTRWKLLPGDVLVLCSDGLVEEDLFLDPADLVRLVAEGGDETAQQLADRLVAAAQTYHRDPGEDEPFGCGDDVTCVVVTMRPET